MNTTVNHSTDKLDFPAWSDQLMVRSRGYRMARLGLEQCQSVHFIRRRVERWIGHCKREDSVVRAESQPMSTENNEAIMIRQLTRQQRSQVV